MALFPTTAYLADGRFVKVRETPTLDWRYAVANGDTTLGLAAWYLQGGENDHEIEGEVTGAHAWRSAASVKNPEQISREVIESDYGIGTDWEDPNEHGEVGFTRAQVETDIQSDDIALLIQQGINRDRAQWFDTSSSASVQHFIDTGRYLLPGEAAEGDAEDTSPGADGSPTSEPCPADTSATRDADGHCTAHGADCADYVLTLRE